MHKINYIVILAVLLSAYCWGASSGGWKFDWAEEFNASTIDKSVWGYEIGYVRNSELQYYTNRSENARIDNGNLLIVAKREPYNGYQYTSASLRSMNQKSWLYGKFEMRAKIDVRLGSWPAWWWLPNTGGWPKGGEIDMMEFYQSKCLFNVMDGNQKWYSQTKSISSLGGNAWAEQFHVWTWEWDSTKIDLSLDGILMNHYDLTMAEGTGPSNTNPFRFPGYMLVNLAIGGINGGNPANTIFPVEYRIDWIRRHVWSPQSQSSTLVVKNGTGTDDYIPGTVASITATMPLNGNVFDKWSIESGNASIDNINNPSAKITMPASNITVTALFKSNSIVKSHKNIVSITQQVKSNSMYDIRGRLIVINSTTSKKTLPAGVYFSHNNKTIFQQVLP